MSDLEEAFTGRFNEHHAYLLTKMLGRVDTIDSDIAEVEDHIRAAMAPFAAAATRLDEIPGVGATTAWMIISEIGVAVSHRRAPAFLGQVHLGYEGIGWTRQGQRVYRARQSLLGPRLG